MNMPNRLEPVNLLNYTGGLNLRRNQFQLAPNESPSMRNVEVDPSGGIAARKGWRRWTEDEITADAWDPRSGYTQLLSTGALQHYVANDDTLIYLSEAGVATDSALAVGATPHLADFASWGDTLYVAAGQGNQSIKRQGTSAPAVIPLASTGSWNDEYTTPAGSTFPSCDFVQAHGDYLFVAGVDESGSGFPNRLRWSHPGNPEDWAELDFQDIDPGGSKVTGLISFSDHLLIFKTNSVWAWYGYGADTWQLIQKSSTIGAPSPQAIARSEGAVYFYSATSSTGIFEYRGGEGFYEVSEALRPAFEGIAFPDEVFLGWVGQRLWVTVPWSPENGVSDQVTDVFVYDPSFGSSGVNSAGLGNTSPAGAWVRHNSSGGLPGPYLSEDVDTTLACIREGDVATLMEVESITSDAVDELLLPVGLITVDDEVIETVGGDPIVAVGENVQVFPTHYQTGWIDAGGPTHKKSWRRPDYICREFGADYALRINAYHDHEEAAPARAHTLAVPGSGGGAQWNEFEWGDGTQWGPGADGSVIVRGKSLGLAKTIQLKIEGPTESPARWGLGAIVLKYIPRRFR